MATKKKATKEIPVITKSMDERDAEQDRSGPPQVAANSSQIHQALQYTANTGGNATYANFLEDHEPIGRQLWAACGGNVIITGEGRIGLTSDGDQTLKRLKSGDA